jgi:hypothetical protein
MKEVNLNFEIKDLNDNVIGNAGQVVAGLLMSETKGDAVKFFDWAISLNKKETIKLDSSDFTKIKELISGSEKLVILAKAPILKYLETIK